MREILTKQSNYRQSSVCARYKWNNPTKGNPHCARDVNETIVNNREDRFHIHVFIRIKYMTFIYSQPIKLKAILSVREILTIRIKYMTFIYSQPIKLKTILSVREILTKQSNYRLSSVCARYKRNNPTKDNPHCAREINETIKLKTILSVRVISTKQSK